MVYQISCKQETYDNVIKMTEIEFYLLCILVSVATVLVIQMANVAHQIWLRKQIKIVTKELKKLSRRSMSESSYVYPNVPNLKITNNNGDYEHVSSGLYVDVCDIPSDNLNHFKDGLPLIQNDFTSDTSRPEDIIKSKYVNKEKKADKHLNVISELKNKQLIKMKTQYKLLNVRNHSILVPEDVDVFELNDENYYQFSLLQRKVNNE